MKVSNKFFDFRFLILETPFLIDFVKRSPIEQLSETYGSSDIGDVKDLYNLAKNIRLLHSGKVVDGIQTAKIIETFPNLSLKHVSEKFYKDKDVKKKIKNFQKFFLETNMFPFLRFLWL